MRAIYVQLLQPKQLDTRVYRPGDWVEVGKQSALKWIAEGSARAVGPMKVELDPKSGILVRGAVSDARVKLDHISYRGSLESILMGGLIWLPWARTLIWQSDIRLRIEFIAAGFGLLERWEIAVPLLSAQGLASEIGSESERAITADVVHDLRVPVYQPGVLFVRKSEATQELLTVWQAEQMKGKDDRLSFLRAVYQVKPLILALPATWIE